MTNSTALVPGTEERVISTFWRVAAGLHNLIIRRNEGLPCVGCYVSVEGPRGLK